ncbi:tyrosinase family protein [Fulvivirgaceae bacterium BMA10]|uniref:Tyrosinase family protein n=1 Tax=Splendidivirga corallicola TaxID=3051826 RepID=A0ABT8KZU3_9BACT|nr:tyrosinase family protein [Fulvivirgaceae bacterium BMA10]
MRLFIPTLFISLLLFSCGGRPGNNTTSESESTDGNGEGQNPAENQVFVRKDINTLSTGDPVIESYKRAIEVMRRRDSSDPTSWLYQAAIHGTYTSPSQELWDQCQHGSFYFLAWHRIYLYYFERIVRDASGDTNWSLPYWNYSDNPDFRRLPEVFRLPTTNNPLYNSERNSRINSGSRLNPSDVSYEAAFSRINFTSSTGSGQSFGGQRVTRPSHFAGPHGRIENQPHDVVHMGIGGWMSDPNTAAQDPIFWLHHANIDRLWEKWLELGNGRANPTNDEAWMNTVFEFFDENGRKVSKTGAQILSTVNQLGYRYDDQQESVQLLASQTPNAESSDESETLESMQQSSKRIFELNVNQKVTDQLTTFSLSAVPQETDDLVLEDASNIEYILYLEGITYDEAPTGSFEVYINLPEGLSDPQFESEYYVGNIGLFGLMNAKHGVESEGGTVAIDLGDAIRNLLKQEKINTEEISITIYRRPLEDPPNNENSQVDSIQDEPLKGSINIKSMRIEKT